MSEFTPARHVARSTNNEKRTKMRNQIAKIDARPLWEPTDNEVQILARNIRASSKGKAETMDVAWLMNVAVATGLNPIKGQICLIITGEGSNKKAMIYVTLAGYLRIAMDSGELEAIRTVYYDEEGIEYKVLPKGKKLWAAQSFLKCKDCETWTEGPVIMWDEFGAPNEKWGEYRKDGKVITYPKNPWAKSPFHMLRKVALSHVLRERFPDRLSGTYTEDELSDEDKKQTIKVEEEPSIEKKNDTPPPHPGTPKVRVEKEAPVEEDSSDPVQEHLQGLLDYFEESCKEYAGDEGETDWKKVKETLDASGTATFPWKRKYPAYGSWTEQHFRLASEAIEDAHAYDVQNGGTGVVDEIAAEVVGG